MKKLIFALFAFLAFTISAQAQANTDVKKETTVKKVRVKGTDVNTVVVKDSEVEKETLVIPKEDVKEQAAVRVKDADRDVKVVKSETKDNTANDAMVTKEKMKQKEELKKSIKEEKAKTKAETKKIVEKKNKDN